jgi:hypothetical protein
LDPQKNHNANPRQLGGTSGIGDDSPSSEGVAMLSVTPRTAETLVDACDLDSLVAEFAGSNTGVVFIHVPFEQLDDCSECPEDDGPLPSLLQVTYRRYGWTYREPVCGCGCAAQKIRALLTSIARPDFIHVHILCQPQTEEAA